MSGLPPTTTIQTVFGQVDDIAARLRVLAAQAPTYAQFNVTLRGLSNQLTALSEQFASFQEQFAAVLLLLQAIIELAPTFGTLLNQQEILRQLGRIERMLGGIPGTPTQIGVDLKNVATAPQKPA
jgi:hypothetical protein